MNKMGQRWATAKKKASKSSVESEPDDSDHTRMPWPSLSPTAASSHKYTWHTVPVW